MDLQSNKISDISLYAYDKQLKQCPCMYFLIDNVTVQSNAHVNVSVVTRMHKTPY